MRRCLGSVVPILVVFIGCVATAGAQDSATETTDGPPGGERVVADGAFPVDVIFTNIAGDPSADVPGVAGAHFAPGTGTTHFDRVYGAPGTNWVLTADTDLLSTEDEVLLVNGVVAVREGTAATWTAGGELVGLLDTRVAVNDAGQFVFATNTDGATDADEYIVMGSTSSPNLWTVAQEGDNASPQLPGGWWGATLETPTITDDGEVGFVADSIIGYPVDQDDAFILGATTVAQEGVSIPTGQAITLTQAWENFDLNAVWIDGGGSHWLAQGDMTGATDVDDVVVVDGAVVLQEGFVIPGSGFENPIDGSGIVGAHMDSAGNWFARGNNDLSETDWVVRNGEVIAKMGDPVFAGASELWSDVDYSDCFFLHVGDGEGNWVIGGVTDADSAANGLLVLNGTTVVARESDPVDLDGNGIFDDNLYFDTFGNDDAYLDTTGRFYIVATVKDGTGARVGQGVFTITLPPIFADGFESGSTSAWSAATP